MNKILSTVKGKIKQVTTPKPDKEYVSPESDYGEFNISYISGIYIKDINYSNIILKLEYDNSSSDIVSNIQEAMSLLSSLELRILVFDNCIYIAGSHIEYSSLFFYIRQVRFDHDRILRSIYSFMKEVDLLDRVLRTYNSDMVRESYYYPYNVDIITVDDVYTQYVADDPDIELYYPLLSLIIHADNKYFTFHISTIMRDMNLLIEDYEIITRFRDEYHDKFNFTNLDLKIKNIFDMNLSVTDNQYTPDEDETIPYNPDIDEFI